MLHSVYCGFLFWRPLLIYLPFYLSKTKNNVICILPQLFLSNDVSVSIGSKDNKKGKSITPSCSWKAIAQVSQEFFKFTRFVVGDGERIRFWEDLWWGDQPLGVQYPRLFRVVIDKNIPISSILGSTRPFSWNFNFRRNFSDSEIEDLGGLMRSLDRLHLSPSVSDKRS